MDYSGTVCQCPPAATPHASPAHGESRDFWEEKEPVEVVEAAQISFLMGPFWTTHGSVEWKLAGKCGMPPRRFALQPYANRTLRVDAGSRTSRNPFGILGDATPRCGSWFDTSDTTHTVYFTENVTCLCALSLAQTVIADAAASPRCISRQHFPRRFAQPPHVGSDALWWPDTQGLHGNQPRGGFNMNTSPLRIPPDKRAVPPGYTAAVRAHSDHLVAAACTRLSELTFQLAFA